MVNVRTKGQNGEREAIRLFELWASPVTTALALSELKLSRNLDQTRIGGYDVLGLDWMALEVKRQEKLSIPMWWRQCCSQADASQVPVLAYRQNRGPWRFRLRPPGLAHCGQIATYKIALDLDVDNMRTWFQHELWFRLKYPNGPDMMAQNIEE